MITTNMSDDMANLADSIHRATGADILDDAFLASEATACGHCGQIRATAVVQIDWEGVEFGRRCADCFLA